MANVVCAAKLILFDDGTTSSVVHFYDKSGAFMKSVPVEPPIAEAFKLSYGDYAPEGHVLAAETRESVPDASQEVEEAVTSPLPGQPAPAVRTEATKEDGDGEAL